MLGKRVVFTANTSGPGRPTELWVTDTAGSAQSVTFVTVAGGGGTTRLDQPFVSAGDAYVGARVAAYNNLGDGCPASMTIIASATGVVSAGYPVSGSACLHELEFDPTGTALAMRFTFAGASGANLAGTTLSSFPNTIFTMDTNALVQTGGTVQQFKYSLDGATPVWTEASGLYSSPSSGAGSTASLRSADVPSRFEVGQIAGVPQAVYVAPGENRFRVTNLAPFAAQSQVYLTNALAGGDALGAFKLSPDGSLLLYEARVAGAWQLWMVALTAPLTELRVDTPAPLIGSSLETDPGTGSYKTVYAFNTDSTRFVWSGDVGGGSVRLNTATVAAPGVATILTPVNEAPHRHLFWSDPNTVVYGEWGFGVPGPHSSLPNLRTVSIGAPLVTMALSSGSVTNSTLILESVDMCRDGTVVYETGNTAFDLNGNGWAFNGLFAVHPATPGDLHAITPWYGNLGAGMSGVGQFDCE